MSLNKFTNTSTGFDLDLDIGCDELKANNITTDNIDANTINGGPIGGGVTNPLTADLKLGGFAIIEPLTAVSPALNIDQLDPAKKIDLKVGGVAKVVVKNGEVELKENLKMNQKQIDDVLVVNNSSGPLNLIGGSGVSAVLIDATPTQGIIIGSDVGKSTQITGDTEISLISNTGNIELNPASQMNVNVGGPRLTVDAIEVGVDAKLNMNNNSILNINTSNTQQTQTELIVKPTVGQLPITATNGVLVTENNLPGGEIFESNSTENKSYKDLNMNGNIVDNVTELNSGLLNPILNLVGRDRVDIGIAGGGRMEIEDTRVFISQFADLNIQGQVIWVRPNTMPTLFSGDTTYIFVGSRNTSNSYVLPANVKIMGLGKNNSQIN
jgi:hypothetical protein